MTTPHPGRWVLGLTASALFLAVQPLKAADPTGTKVALLVGVTAYDHSKFDDLKFPERDVEDLAALLKQNGYSRIVLLTTKAASRDERYRPTSDNVRRMLKDLLKDRTKRDTVLVAFSGHGLQSADPPDSYLCPADARMGQPDTLLSLSRLYKELDESGAGTRLLLIDACRNDPAAKGGKGVDGDGLPKLPKGMAVLFSCSPKQKSFEHESWGHGAFFYTVLEGLRPTANGRLAADVDGDGEVDFDELSRYVRKTVPGRVEKILGTEQTPNAVANLSGMVTLARGTPGGTTAPPPPVVETPPSSTAAAEVEVASLRMKLKLIQPGKFLMGAALSDPDAARDETPQHDVTLRKPFYLAVHEVTKAQFDAFVKETDYETESERLTPSRPLPGPRRPGILPLRPGMPDLPRLLPDFPLPLPSRGGKGTWKDPGFSQDRDHPVVYVSREDARAFCAWLTKKEGKTFRLPTEAEWEYACRAGTKTRFCTGDREENLKEHANLADASAFRDRVVSPFIQAVKWDDGYVHTAPVGKLKPNAFGIFDMHGNVWEWCGDGRRMYTLGAQTDPEGTKTGPPIARGGGWDSEAKDCRSTRRRQVAEFGDGSIGFRVALDAVSKRGLTP